MDWKSIIPKVIGGLIVAALVGLFSLCLQRCNDETNISLKFIGDENFIPIDLSKSPFKVSVQGIATHTKNKFVYLVVKDSTAEWIQPGLGKNVQGEFEGWCYLGIKDDFVSTGKSYVIFGVVTNRVHGEYEHLDRESIMGESKHIQLTRG